jgi:hypothetical protein
MSPMPQMRVPGLDSIALSVHAGYAYDHSAFGHFKDNPGERR